MLSVIVLACVAGANESKKERTRARETREECLSRAGPFFLAPIYFPVLVLQYEYLFTLR